MGSGCIFNFLPVFGCGHPSISPVWLIPITEELGENHTQFNGDLTEKKKKKKEADRKQGEHK